MITTKLEAIQSLVPSPKLVMKDDEIISWTSSETQPTEDEITAEQTRLDGVYAAEEYKRTRRPLYPQLTDFADAMYWNSKGDSTKLEAYYAACEKVKTDNPKPS